MGETKPEIKTITLYPHRSLSPRGLRIVLGIVVAANLVVATLFLTLRAWPVFGFMGLDVALVFWAFRANMRAAQEHETIVIDGEKWTFHRSNKRGETSRTFNRRWMRLELEYDEARELVGRLFFISHGKRTEVGRFLGAEERKALADHLRRM